MSQICERCEQTFDKLESFVYNVKCADGVLEYTAKYCSECCDICESEKLDDREIQ